MLSKAQASWFWVKTLELQRPGAGTEGYSPQDSQAQGEDS